MIYLCVTLYLTICSMYMISCRMDEVPGNVSEVIVFALPFVYLHLALYSLRRSIL